MQKKVLLSAVNAKYIHSNLAVRYLKKYCETSMQNIYIDEFSINDNTACILKRLYRSKADIYGFSCYIWNIELVEHICSSLKKVKPEAVIILGGPEVSYDPEIVLARNISVDYVVFGEGEETFLELLKYINEGKGTPSGIKGIAYREPAGIASTQPRPPIPSLDMIPFPYDSLEQLENRIIYYETSRGCPFNCQYCLSSTTHGVRFLSAERLQQDIRFFTNAGVRQVKLVDRTFNCDIKRAVNIMEYIIGINSSTNFHFEIAPDLMDEEFLETVRKAPPGLFQFEIGIQSTNPRTLTEIKRKMDFGKAAVNIASLKAIGNAHIHLDLIAGLPYEDIKSFRKSFNDVYRLKSDMLQLGFLKLLKGSGLRERSSEYGIRHNDFPPYEVLETNWLSYEDLLRLKDIENVLELYHNSGRFRHTLDFTLQALYLEPYDFYLSLSEYWNSKEYSSSSKSLNDLYSILLQFIVNLYRDVLGDEQLSLINEYLKLDWLLYARSGRMPEAIRRYDHSSVKEELQQFLKNNYTEIEAFEAFRSIPAGEILKHVGYEVFERNIFGGDPSDCPIVMFYPYKRDHAGMKSFYSTMPLGKIIK